MTTHPSDVGAAAMALTSAMSPSAANGAASSGLASGAMGSQGFSPGAMGSKGMSPGAMPSAALSPSAMAPMAMSGMLGLATSPVAPMGGHLVAGMGELGERRQRAESVSGSNAAEALERSHEIRR